MAISRDKAIVIGVVVLGALSFLVYRQAKHDQELGSADHRDLPDVKGTDDLDKIEITNGDKPRSPSRSRATSGWSCRSTRWRTSRT